MSMLTYFKSLLPSFGQDRIIDDLQRMRAEVEENLLPSLIQASTAFHDVKFKSDVALIAQSKLQKRFDAAHQGLFEILHDIFKDAPAKLELLENAVEEYFAKDVEKESLTYRRASILQFIELYSFAIQYTIRMVLRVIIAESYEEAGKSSEVDSYMSAKEKAYFAEHYDAWLAALNVADKTPTQIEQAFAAVPEVVIDEAHADAHASTIGAKALDPMGMNFVKPSWNPIYRVRLVMAEWDVQLINRSKEERKMVELRLRELKNRRDGVDDAKLQHQIEVTESRLKSLEFKIAKLSGNLH
jgi:hypothetical protein